MMQGELITESSGYVKQNLLIEWKNWLILIVFFFVQSITIHFVPLFSGYIVRVYADNSKSAPKTDGILKLFIDGWKLNIIGILFMIPAIIIAIAFGGLSALSIITGISAEKMPAEIMGLLLGSTGLFLAVIIFMIFTLFMFMAFVNFARKGKMVDAFAVGDIAKKISNGIGWGGYFVMWVVIWILGFFFTLIIFGLSVVPLLGLIFGILLGPLWGVFLARIMSNVYDA